MRYPAKYEPGPPHPSLLQSVGWRFTKLGRVRLRLRRGCRRLENARLWRKLERDATRIAVRPVSEIEGAKGLRVQILAAAAWRSLIAGKGSDGLVGDLEHAADLIERLEKTSKDSSVLHRLRWDLVRKGIGRTDRRVLRHWASAFLSDRWVRAPGDLDAIHETLAWAYEENPAEALVLVDSANRNLQVDESVAAMRALCTVPERFRDVQEAQEWARRVDTTSLTFSDPALAAALVVQARLAEWSGDFTRMVELADDAYRRAPTSEHVLYWRIRAHLQAAIGGTEVVHDAVDSVPDDPKWTRIVLALRLYENPQPEKAAELLPALAGEMGEIDAPEMGLFLSLLESALEATPAESDDVLYRKGQLCRSVEEIVGRSLGWTQLVLALKELCVDNDFDSAAARLERDDVLQTGRATELGLAARALAGRPEVEFLAGGGVLDGISPELFEHLPLLVELRDLLDLVDRATAGETGVRGFLVSHSVPDAAPPWFGWLLVRCCVLVLDPPAVASVVERLPDVHQAVKWELRRWCREGAFVALASHPLVGSTGMDSVEAEWPPDSKIREGLGSLTGQMLKIEAGLTHRYELARQQLGLGDDTTARALLEEILSEVGGLDVLIERWWRPLCEYWLAVISIRKGETSGADALAGLIQCWLAGRAEAQLALLAIRKGDLEEADRWLDRASDHATPGLLYARALLLSRRGEADGATRRLESAISALGDTSPYARACRRLLAAIAEREGRVTHAEHLYRGLLREEPNDAVSAARLLRLELRRRYDRLNESGGSFSDEAVEALEQEDSHRKDVPWFAQYDLLAWIIEDAARDEESFGLDWARSIASPARRLLANRLLAAGRADRARQVLESDPSDPSAEVSRSFLKAWHILNRAWIANSADGVRAAHPSEAAAGITIDLEAVKSCARAVASVGDPALVNERDAWVARLQLAWKLASGNDDVQTLSAHEQLEAFGDSGRERWRPEQSALALVIESLAGGDCTAFLEAYSELDHALDRLPVDGPDLWLAAGRVWFDERNWGSLLDAELPDCVGDLADWRVRHLIGMAYCQRCVAEAQNDSVQRALQNLRRARGVLEPMLTNAEG